MSLRHFRSLKIGGSLFTSTHTVEVEFQKYSYHLWLLIDRVLVRRLETKIALLLHKMRIMLIEEHRHAQMIALGGTIGTGLFGKSTSPGSRL
jgi:hypothetical protein